MQSPPNSTQLSLVDQNEFSTLKKSQKYLITTLQDIITPDNFIATCNNKNPVDDIINSTIQHIAKFITLDGYSVLLVNNEMAFAPHSHSSEQYKTKTEELLPQWIEQGFFSYAIRKNRAFVLNGNKESRTHPFILHAIAVRETVMGMFVGYLPEESHLDETELVLLTTVLMNCCNNLEIQKLHHEQIRQNQNLEHLIQERTRQLEITKNKAIESAQLKSKFIATMSHEIRTPMNGIIGMAQLLNQTSLDDQQQHYAQVILQSARTLTSLINDILDLSKIEANRLELDKQPFDLHQLANDTLELLSVQAHNKKLELNLDTKNSQYAVFEGDPARIRQVFINLISNAIKFTEKGSITVTIDSKANDAGLADIHIEVRDTGVGIDAETAKKLFIPFTQADVSTYQRYGGTGLGLSICKQLIERMEGKIGVQSELNKGSTFIIDFQLPTSNATPQTIQFNTLAQFPDEQSVVLNQMETPFQGRVLVAEDNPVNQEIITHFLEAMNIKVKIAENGKEAIYFLANAEYDLVLMDYQMPELDGIEATKYIRKTPGHNQRIPIVALSASALQEDLNAFKEAGMDDFIAKPIELPQLQRMLTKWLQMSPVDDGNAIPEGNILSQPSTDNTLEHSKVATLKQMMGPGFETLKETFLNGTQEKLNNLKEAIKNNSDELEFLAHSLKGSCGTIGAKAMAERAKDLEDAIRRKQTSQFSTIANELEQLFLKTEQQLNQYSDA